MLSIICIHCTIILCIYIIESISTDVLGIWLKSIYINNQKIQLRYVIEEYNEVNSNSTIYTYPRFFEINEIAELFCGLFFASHKNPCKYNM